MHRTIDGFIAQLNTSVIGYRLLNTAPPYTRPDWGFSWRPEHYRTLKAVEERKLHFGSDPRNKPEFWKVEEVYDGETITSMWSG